VYLAFDADEAGDAAAQYWHAVLPKGLTKRARPEKGKDASDMHGNGYLSNWLVKMGVM
jgi:hypothetical protein